MPPIEQEEMVFCVLTGEDIPISEAHEVNGEYIKLSLRDSYCICEDCEKIFYSDDAHRVEYGNRTVCKSCKDDSYFECDGCGERHHIDEQTTLDNDDRICRECRDSGDYFECLRCNGYFHTDNMRGDYCCSCADIVDEEDGEIVCTEGQLTHTSAVNELPEQEVIPMPDIVRDWLNEFYSDEYKYVCHKPRDVCEKTTLSLSTDMAKTYFNAWRIGSSLGINNIYHNTFKYRNCEGLSANGVKIRYTYIDNLGKRKEKEESIMAVRDYYNKICGGNFQQQIPDKNEFSKYDFEIEMSADFEHKIALANANNKAFNSCQNPGNKSGMARGIYDWFTNGCNVPISIKVDGQIVGRQLTRFMIDKNGKEYLFLDRLYLNDRYSQDKRKIYEGIAHRLHKKYTLALPISSAHDDDVASWLSRSRLPMLKGELSLRQATRKMSDISRSYYNDSGTRTYRKTSNELYDKIDKYNYCVVEK